MTTFLKDVRYGARLMTRSPGFAAVAVFSVAIGIGANGAIFSLVNALFLRPLPVAHPSELAAVFTSDYSGPLYGTSSYPDYVDFQERNGVFSGLVACTMAPLSLTAGNETDRVVGELITGNYFSVLGVQAALGRTLLPEEGRTPGQDGVTVLSHGFWKRRFGSDPGIVGKTLRLNGHPFTVVGIARESFPGMLRGLAVDLWVPLTMQTELQPGRNDRTNRGNRSLFLMGRFSPRATLTQAQERFNLIARELHAEHPESWTNVRKEPRVVTVVSESEARVFPEVRAPVIGFMAVLMIVMGLVLLIACANVAGLLLARSTARRKEMAIRLSLGSGRGRLVRQLLTESLLLSLLAGGVGLALAVVGTKLLMAFKPPVPVPIALDLSVDWRVVGFTLAISLLTGTLFGLAPALESSRPNLMPTLKDEGASGAERKHRLRSLFVVAQVALSLLLLIGSGLFLRSLRNAVSIDPGFDPKNLLVLSVDLSLRGYSEPARLAFYRDLTERLPRVPGVEAASLTGELPLGLGGSRRGITIEGYTAQPGEDMEVHSTGVGPGYFQTMRIPVLRGRAISEADREGAPGVVMVNEAFERRYWPGQDALGKRIEWGRGGPGPPSPGLRRAGLEVIGVVKDGKYVTLGEDPRPFFYYALLQSHESSATLVVRASESPTRVMPAVRSVIQALDKDLPVFDAKMMGEHLALALLPARLAGAVLGAFGLVGLVLAAVGIYGMVAYWVARRAREMGLRLALGATPRDVVWLVVKRGMGLALVGLGLGAAGALSVTRFLGGLLYGVSPTDPVTFGGLTLFLAGVALAASYLPARRAARVDPLVALRYE